MPLVSVIVPVYKAEKYLHKCVDSLLVQTMTDFEILLIDDGSPDKSGLICDEYASKDSRVRVFHKGNGGVASARQLGVEKSSGEYIIHVDPDDWVESQMLDELYIKAKKDNVDMLICDFYEHDLNGERYIVQKPTRLICDSVLCDMFLFLHGSTWNKLIKRDCIIENNVNFDLDLSFCEDLYFNANLLLCNIKVSYLNKAFYHYERTENQNSIANPQNKTIIDFEHDLKLFRKFDLLLKNHSCWECAVSDIAYLLVSRAFHSNYFTSKEFRKNCFPYLKFFMRYKNIKCYEKIIFFFSCIGIYKCVYNFFLVIKNFK